jgi:hypothetical protein
MKDPNLIFMGGAFNPSLAGDTGYGQINDPIGSRFDGIHKHYLLKTINATIQANDSNGQSYTIPSNNISFVLINWNRTYPAIVLMNGQDIWLPYEPMPGVTPILQYRFSQFVYYDGAVTTQDRTSSGSYLTYVFQPIE